MRERAGEVSRGQDKAARWKNPCAFMGTLGSHGRLGSMGDSTMWGWLGHLARSLEVWSIWDRVWWGCGRGWDRMSMGRSRGAWATPVGACLLWFGGLLLGCCYVGQVSSGAGRCFKAPRPL